jgi:2-polyprenyl-6-methoxyphenol hydroxylase-like FAD-dependent oxidoreductase
LLEDAMSSVLIVGGGLGGMATAAALHRIGVEAHVYEQSDALREVGAGLSVWPNASRVLQELGVLGQATARSGEIRRLEVRDPVGRLLSAVMAPGRMSMPSLCIHRADLLALLVSLVPSDCVHLGKRFEMMHESADCVTVRFEDGSEAVGDVLVGADGLFSKVRTALFGRRQPTYRGCHAWRGLADAELDLGTTVIEFWGAGRRFGVEPLGPGRVFWYATENAPEGTIGDRQSWKPRLGRLFADWDERVLDAIDATPPEALLCHDLYDRPARARWGRRRITLLGDAAHPTTPYLGQGACMALEDSLVLARCVGRYGASPSALRRYKCERLLRTAAVTWQSRQIGRLGQCQHPLIVALRDWVVRLTPSGLQEWPHRLLFRWA